MLIQVNTDHNIEGRETLASHVQGVVEDALGRFKGQITRVEVHLSDQNSDKGGEDDKRCLMEVRLQGRQPTAVSHSAESLDQAINGAIDKLERSIEHTLGKLHDRR